MDRRAEWPDWLNVSRETEARLSEFAALIARWSKKINLVSKSSGTELWQRHILDSAQIFLLRPARCDHWVDIGSGGGFPGLVIAILAHESASLLNVTLIESDQRKAVFLREAVRQLGLNTTVISTRIEALSPQKASVLSARALAPLSRLCIYASRHLDQDGTALFQKGKSYKEEVLEAQKSWNFAIKVHDSKTDSAAVILELKDLLHV